MHRVLTNETLLCHQLNATVLLMIRPTKLYRR